VEANVRDGAEVYRITRQVVDPRLRQGRVTLDFDTVPDAGVWRWIAVDRRAGLELFNTVHARGVARTVEALRAWWGLFQRASSTPPFRRAAVVEAVTERVVGERLRYLEAAEGRRRVWLATRSARAP
jgi:hypothetical protein